ncbi:MAG: PadR family transcriptional regulator [Candidatus Aminicenantes bacterium]|nr:MAG: PadR family transcriptional regulator [Candidatus Aminicenantes bacterium]
MKLLTKQEELFLLAVFDIGQDAYLVNIREHLKKHSGKDWGFGSIYITLEKLRKRGLIKTHVGKPSARQGGKAIKYYELSKEGIQALRDNKRLHDKMWKEFIKHA